jgi:alpha-N-arabinofuranosidase
MQLLFRESSGAIVHPTTISSSSSSNVSVAASAITWKDSDNSSFLRVKASKIP